MPDVKKLDTNRVLFRCPRCGYEEWKQEGKVPGVTFQMSNDWFPTLYGICPGCIYRFLDKMFPKMMKVEALDLETKEDHPVLTIRPIEE